jgi:uncharacterized protein YceK
MNAKKRIFLMPLLVAAGLLVLSGCASSPVASGTQNTEGSSAGATDVEREAAGDAENEICVINKLATDTFMNWTLARDIPDGGYGEELVNPGSKNCKNGKTTPPYLEVNGYFIAEFEDGATWRLSAKNQARHNPSFVIKTDSGPHSTAWGCAFSLNEDQTVVLDDGTYAFTLLRKSDFTATRYVVTVSQSAGAVNLQAPGCKVG